VFFICWNNSLLCVICGSEIFARFKSLEGGEEGPISDAEKLVNAVGGTCF
jgi:hypothetical protein